GRNAGGPSRTRVTTDRAGARNRAAACTRKEPQPPVAEVSEVVPRSVHGYDPQEKTQLAEAIRETPLRAMQRRSRACPVSLTPPRFAAGSAVQPRENCSSKFPDQTERRHRAEAGR